jgi:hypothetical protein
MYEQTMEARTPHNKQNQDSAQLTSLCQAQPLDDTLEQLDVRASVQLGEL